MKSSAEKLERFFEARDAFEAAGAVRGSPEDRALGRAQDVLANLNAGMPFHTVCSLCGCRKKYPGRYGGRRHSTSHVRRRDCH